MQKAYEFDFVYDTQAGWSLCHAADCGGSAFGQ